MPYPLYEYLAKLSQSYATRDDIIAAETEEGAEEDNINFIFSLNEVTYMDKSRL